MPNFAYVKVIPMSLFRFLRIVILAFFALGVFFSCSNGKKGLVKNSQKSDSSSVAIDGRLQKRLAEFASKPRCAGQFAFYVYDLTADKPVYGCNENQAMSSASCMKLLSGVAGLHLLGNGYRYSTSLMMRGRVASNGVLMGDAAFKAGLDPQLDSPDLAAFAKALKGKGVKKIAGRLIVDLTIKAPVESEPHWYPWDLSFSRYGLLYKGAPRVVKSLKAAMRGQGISIADSQVVMMRTPANMRCVYTRYSSIGDVVKRMWKNSSNTQATAMLYTIGHRVDPRKSPVEAGVEYLRKFLREDLGQKDTALVIHDGCGLCTHNHLSPKALVAILTYGYKDKRLYPVLRNNLSIAGVDGTLAREMTNARTRGKIRAKTGTLSHPYGISSLAGYCEAANGHLLAFAIMDCEMSVLDARVLQRHLGEAMVK